MATGIVSVAADLLGLAVLAWPLLAINVVEYLILWLRTVLWLRRWPRLVLADMTGRTPGPGFLTLAAGTCVLGTQGRVVVGQPTGLGVGLWLLGLLLWLGLGYAFLGGVIVQGHKPDLEHRLSGSWLLLVVSTQAPAVLAALLAPEVPATQMLLFLALVLYLLGGVLYLVLITLLVERLAFYRMAPDWFRPDYWINMGAAAITALCGATLVASAGHWPFLEPLVPVLQLLSLLYWAVATWWIPLLGGLEVWHVLARRRAGGERAGWLRYDPATWALVFPLGMYTVATHAVVGATGLGFLLPIAQVMLYVALAAWLLTFVALVRHLISWARRAPRATAPAHLRR
jgi:tellurite resistance protein TehA-like permease